MQTANVRFHALLRLEAAEGVAVLPVAAAGLAAGPAVAGPAVAEQQPVDAAEQPA